MPRNISTTLNYFEPLDEEAPYQYALTAPEGKLLHNLGVDTRPVIIHDARGKQESFSLDKNGFQFVRHVSQETSFEDDEEIKTTYYEEGGVLFWHREGASHFTNFASLRLSSVIFGRRKRNHNGEDEPGARGPVERVHVDQTFDASVLRVQRELGDEADHYLKGRVRIINVWRPIRNPVAHKPLAVSDWRCLVPERDLVSVRLIYPNRTSSTFSVLHNPDHKWYYLADQTPEEVTLIKCYDSAVDRARLSPHSAFLDKTSPPEAPHRESIEVRCLAFDVE
ncbi:uncharacterized protein FIBRA_03596 [Fibroporia radiculosa]|uniref:Methyltransferase n=1 Tax=Fibroporia radiculosa TaxID=599839 RepID=J4GNK3_9APHY|nr:uncharacterized protein FIBRA_03596 [Fibroporia radiculosa]CCM01540.1 predicted protein [Fibroporia radiculosa]